VVIIEVIYFIIFIFLLKKIKVFKIESLPEWVIPVGFSLKVLIGIVFLIIYLHPNTNNSVPSDTMRFMEESKILNSVFYKSPIDYFKLLFSFNEDKQLIKTYLDDTFLWNAGSYTLVNDSRNLIRLNSLIYFISFNSPFIHNLFMCLFGLLGVKYIYIAFERYSLLDKRIFFFIILLIPSVAFWTSGILKEPILFLGFSMFIRAILANDSKNKKLIFFTISILILISFKPYNLICLIPSLLFGFIHYHYFKKSIFKSLLLTFSLITIGVIIFPTKRDYVVKYLSRKHFDFDHIGKGGVFTNYNDSSLLYFKMDTYEYIDVDMKDSTLKVNETCSAEVVSKSHSFENFTIEIPNHSIFDVTYNVGGALSYIKTEPINNSFDQLLKNIPDSLINSLFRPFPNDPGSGLKHIALLELWLVYLFLITAIIFKRKNNTIPFKIIIYCLFFTISLSVVIGLTTPVLGAIFRYRFLSYLGIVLISALIIDPTKIKLIK